MKKAFENFMILCFIFWCAYALSGCATFKDMAKYRSGVMDKCECAPAWGLTPMGTTK